MTQPTKKAKKRAARRIREKIKDAAIREALFKMARQRDVFVIISIFEFIGLVALAVICI